MIIASTGDKYRQLQTDTHAAVLQKLHVYKKTTKATQPHTDREAGDTGVNHVRKQMAYEDKVVEALTDTAGRVHQ
jgi:hypothetical protein